VKAIPFDRASTILTTFPFCDMSTSQNTGSKTLEFLNNRRGAGRAAALRGCISTMRARSFCSNQGAQQSSARLEARRRGSFAPNDVRKIRDARERNRLRAGVTRATGFYLRHVTLTRQTLSRSRHWGSNTLCRHAAPKISVPRPVMCPRDIRRVQIRAPTKTSRCACTNGRSECVRIVSYQAEDALRQASDTSRHPCRHRLAQAPPNEIASIRELLARDQGPLWQPRVKSVAIQSSRQSG